ncbi:hypothetical protein FZC76_08345 [Sutcliffiella horikoshii]|uniref:Uncharacterized protein n=1 Tax=Sutcliffiella horikoshii TaxID=79883 RepID=A0A5D4T0Z5_9BACI|nr:hypothetical protein [Sutcliffiella horikoshii]TYS68929.1 hypothetical protein FZC76_08345 [Sutcliffiella horikoshii]
MNVLRNDKGYTILIVLLTIVVIGLIAPPLINSVMSSSLQNQKTEENVQLENLTEMGIRYFRNDVAKNITAGGMTTSKSPDEIMAALKKIDEAELIPLGTDSGTMKYRVGYINEVRYDPEDTNYILIDYKSEAFVNDAMDDKVETYRLKYTGSPEGGEEEENEENPPPSGGNDRGCLDLNSKNGKIHLSGKTYCYLKGSFVIDEPIKITGQATLEIDGSVVFRKSVDIAGQGNLDIFGSIHFNENVFVRGNGKIIIDGSVQFDKPPSRKGNGSIKVNKQEYK